MGQKVHPRSLRLGIIYGWDSNWFGSPKEYAKNVKEDQLIRKFITKKLKACAISRVEIDRKAQKLIIRIVTGRPGMVVGRGGQGLDQVKKHLQILTGSKDIQLDVIEVARIDMEAQLVAESIAQQLEKRVAFRRVMKQSIQRTMRAGAKGIKIMISGRLGGAEIARSEWAKEGRIPLHTFRADIDYGFYEAMTVFGIIGVKVWIFKGEILPGEKLTRNVKSRSSGGPQGGAPGGPGLQGAGRRPGGPGGGGPGGPGGRGRGAVRRSGPVKTSHMDESKSKPQSEGPPSSPSTES